MESDKIKGFVRETAEELGISERTIEREIQIATNLKEIYEELYPETRWGYASLKNLIPFRNTEVLSGENFCGGALKI